ncbi:antiviral reverse transcriptase Drt3a [uncultured Roseibium sp.]|uniref:antiviral reverse transcriptase Drt3a n=1 Tax=uncultured Roseibium sp. TaxID=1936171 RepID=UPI002603ED04|nr:antiviral reverse transcriptase Drt3a [uncultured Roseibium sp.]
MLNQTFSLVNFEDIYDEDNRKGRNFDTVFFPTVSAASNRLSSKARALRAFKKRHVSYKKYPKGVQRRYDVLLRNLNRQKKRREELISNALKSVASNINKRSFRVGIVKNTINTMDVYQRDDTPESYYALRQVSRNIRSLYKTKPANRNIIVSQVQNLLSDDYPYVLIRTDISSFFESIDQSRLIHKLVQDQLLSATSIKLIKQVLWDYSHLAGTPGKGIPRGLSISSDLAELYLKVVDRKIQEMNGVAFYARYVDDIFLLISPSKLTDTTTYLTEIGNVISGHGLALNTAKTVQLNRDEHGKKFDYLGYEFTLRPGHTDIDITSAKFDRLRFRLERSFGSYEKHRHKNAKAAYRLLLKRIRFLTTNTRLINNKGNAFVGIFFSNPNLNRHSRLVALDGILANKVANIQSITLKTKLSSLSFKSGHQQKPFTKFNRHPKFGHSDEFSKIVEAWRYGN